MVETTVLPNTTTRALTPAPHALDASALGTPAAGVEALLLENAGIRPSVAASHLNHLGG